MRTKRRHLSTGAAAGHPIPPHVVTLWTQTVALHCYPDAASRNHVAVRDSDQRNPSSEIIDIDTESN